MKVVLIDDHDLFRAGLRGVIASRPEFEVVAESGVSEELLGLVERHQPELVLLDVGMPGPSTFALAAQCLKLFPKSKIIFLTGYDDEHYVSEAVRVHASGFLLKEAGVLELFAALHAALAGKRFVNSSFYPTCHEHPGPHVHLTPREREVMKLLAEGNSVKEVAIVLGLSAKTIEAHKFNLMQKLNLRNKAELVSRAYKEGVLPCPRFHVCAMEKKAEVGKS